MAENKATENKATENEATKYEYKTLTLDQMKKYIEENAPQDKAWFKSIAFETRKKKHAVKQVDGEGNPIMKESKKNKGKQYQATKMVDVEGGAEKPVLNLLKAKRAFCERYMPDIIPQPKEKSVAEEIFENW